MILVDANILLYAEDALSTRHREARDWWDAQLSGSDPVCLCWPVVSAFIRISTNPRAFERPLSLDQALARVRSWFDQPCVRVIQPTARHWDVFARVLTDGQATANLVTDAHLAALAIEHGCELHSTDGDFARFPTLRWKNPLSPARSGARTSIMPDHRPAARQTPQTRRPRFARCAQPPRR